MKKMLFKSEDLNMGTCVYIYRNKDNVLYVGSSVNGLTRPLSGEHQAAKRCRSEKADLEVIAFPTIESARQRERELIRELRPLYNVQHQPKEEIVEENPSEELDVTEFARRGGLARGRKLTREELSAAGRKAVQARWAKRSVLPAPEPVPVVGRTPVIITADSPLLPPIASDPNQDA